MAIRVLFVIGILAAGGRESPVRAAKPNYLQKVRAYVDAMIEHGRDTLGERASPLFLISIDPDTMAIPDIKRPRGLAVAVFLGSGPLPQTTGKARDYCAASRCDTLMMQLLDLYLIRNKPDAKVKLIYTER